MADSIKVDMDKIQEVKNQVNVSSDENANGDPIPEGSTLFTKREWTMRYAAPFKALMFMAAPMVIIMLVNSLYGIIDKQLALNYAVANVTHLMDAKAAASDAVNGVWNLVIGTNYGAAITDQEEFAKILINVSTQYSNTVITLLEAMSLLTSVGTAIKWGQAMGERNKQRMDSIVTMGLIQSGIMSGLGILIIHFAGPAIIISQANGSYGNRDNNLIYALSNEYTQMFTYGFPLLVFATFISTLIRTEGKVWWVIFINLSAIALNIGCGEALMEAAPAAEKMQSAVYGSFIAWSWMIVTGLLIIGFSKNTLLKPNFKHVRLTWSDAGIIWLYGISPFVSNFIFAVANYVTTLLITIAHPWNTNNLSDTIRIVWFGGDKGTIPGGTVWDGTGAIPDAWVSVQKGEPFYISRSLQALSSAFPWMNILYAPLLGMMQGANANYAYCKGAGKRFRMIQIWRIHLMIDMIWGLCVLIIIAAAGGPMMELFGYNNPGSHRWWFFAYVCGIMFGGMTYAAISLFQGTGDSFNATLVATLRSLVCNVGFIVLGWIIVHFGFRNNPGNDWIMFMMNGLCEIPAVIVAMLIVWGYFSKLIKKYQVNDTPDSFKAPSLLTAALNEVQIWKESLQNRARQNYLRKLNNLKQRISSAQLKQMYPMWELHIKQSELEDSKLPAAKKKEILNKLETKADNASTKYKKIEEELIKSVPVKQALWDQQLKDRLATIDYKARFKDAKATEKYRFRNQSLGNGTEDLEIKQLYEWKEAKDYDLLMSESLDYEQASKDIEDVYNKKLKELDETKAKKLAYLKQIENGNKVLNPFTLMFVGQEPQPLNRKDKVMAAEQAAKAKKKVRK